MIYLTDVSRYTVNEADSIRQALLRMEENEYKFLLVVNADNRLLATMTDGDIRRFLLRVDSLDAPVANVGNRNPRTVGVRSREAAGQIMDTGVDFVPVMDGDKLAGVFVALFETEKVSGAVALVMAGGEGQRLRPITQKTPKPLVEVGGKPMIERIVEQLVLAGFHRIYISVRYLSEQIVDFLGDGSRFGAELSYVRETGEPLGTMGCLSMVDYDEETDDCLVVNGDLVTTLDFHRLYQFHKVTGAGMTVAVRRETYEIPFGVLDIDGTDVGGVREKPKLQFHINAGIYVVGRTARALLKTGQRRDATQLIEQLIDNKGKVSAFHFDDYWQDVGNLASLEKARLRFDDRS